MKKVVRILIAIVYIILIIGVPISVHHCETNYEKSSAIKNAPSHCCSSEITEISNCHSTHTNTTKIVSNSCCTSNTQDNKECCCKQEKMVKWNSDQQLFSNHKVSFKLCQLELLNQQEFFNFKDIKPQVNTVFLDLPPPQTTNKQVLQQQFTFYG